MLQLIGEGRSRRLSYLCSISDMRRLRGHPSCHGNAAARLADMRVVVGLCPNDLLPWPRCDLARRDLPSDFLPQALWRVKPRAKRPEKREVASCLLTQDCAPSFDHAACRSNSSDCTLFHHMPILAATHRHLARRPNGVRQFQSPIQLSLHDAVFGGQISDARRELLIHRLREVGENRRHAGLSRFASGARAGGIAQFSATRY